MQELSKEWFELQDHRRRLYSRAVWIPVYGTIHPTKKGKYPEIGYVEETLAIGSAIIFGDCRNEAEELNWHRWRPDSTTSYIDDDGRYFSGESFFDYPDKQLGFYLVLHQYHNSLHPRDIIINQDFLLAYGLLKEGDQWLRPSEGYEIIVKQTRDTNGKIALVEFRTDYLKDYLAARNCSLRLYYYRQRQAVIDYDPKFDWPADNTIISEKNNRCEVRCDEIGSSGDTPGTTWAMFSAWRTDVDPEEDVPDFSNDDDDATATEQRSGTWGNDGGRFRVSGELWRGEWIEPASESCRVGYAEPQETLLVSVDGGGSRVDLESLGYETVGKYLWFKPEIINALLSYRGGHLIWYTQETGGISPSPDSPLHFGVNKLGLVNVYAYDIARRPLWGASNMGSAQLPTRWWRFCRAS